MDKLKIGIDLDDTLCNLRKGLLTHFGSYISGVLCNHSDLSDYHLHNIKKLNISKEEMDRLWKIFWNSQTFQNVQPCVGAVELINRLHANGARIHIINGRETQRKDITLAYLEKHFPMGKIEDVHFLSTFGDNPIPRTQIVKMLGLNGFVDDHAGYCNEITQQCDIPVYMPSKPWNKKAELHKKTTRINNLNEINI